MRLDTEKNVQGRLKRIAGQVGGIQHMVEKGRGCVDVLLQIAAVQAALLETGRLILASHVETYLTDAVKSRDAVARREKIDELMAVFSRFSSLNGSGPGAAGDEGSAP